MNTAIRIASTADGGYVAGQHFHAYYPDFQGRLAGIKKSYESKWRKLSPSAP
ncbi:MAG: hypothetical protein K2F71_00635 [Paramuribaculum sp.]|nr:hypothetical protein [Paramuribaculum sp.]